MRTHQQSLIQLLTQTASPDLQTATEIAIKNLQPQELANLFVDVVFLVTAMRFVLEKFWIQNQKNATALKEMTFINFIKKILKVELEPVLFFHSFLENSSPEEIQQIGENAATIQKIVVAHIKTKPYPGNKLFAATAVRLMSDLFEFEHQLQIKKKEDSLLQDFSLYRTFDVLDEIFGLNYALESTQTSPDHIERISQGSGVGVQSSYATILMVLRYLKLASKSRFIDLGAGFGRVGLVVGLMRPDIDFAGYEFVEGRVSIANQVSKNFGLDQHVRFHTQDLSQPDFQIPEAETYYMYDPFSAETYKHVLTQLSAIGTKKQITVITKGDAKKYLLESGQRMYWSSPQEFDSGNFCLFRSNARRV